MKLVQILVVFVSLLFVCYLIIVEWENFEEERSMPVNGMVLEKDVHIQKKVKQNPLIEEDLYHWINQPLHELEKAYGDPIRKDLSAYGYTWWVYTDERNDYVQFGISNNKIKTIFATGKDIAIGPIQIGQSHELVSNKLSFENELSYQDGHSTYKFKLTQNDLSTQALVKLSDDVFLQCYFDAIENKLSSVRLLAADILLLHAPYEIEYRGSLPEEPIFTEKQWLEIQEGMANQIFLISNVKRHQYGLDPLLWDEEVSEVALLHSRDMEENNYFSHYSLNGDGLRERLDKNDVFYFSAGENIAAQYPDAPSAIEGWLNSKAHRDALLEPDYTHLGVGVHRLYFTQNFIAKP